MSRKLKLFAGAVIATAMAGSGANADTVNYDTALAPPGYYNGSGNANAGFTTNTTPSGVELGLGVNLQFLGVVHPTSTNIYNVPTGISTGTAATWDFEYSVNLGASGLQVGGISSLLTVLNTANGQSIAFNPGSVGDNATNGTVGFQNAENLGFAFVSFFFPLFGFDPNAIDTYVVTLSAQINTGGSLGSVSEIINAVATPLPAALPLFAGGLGVMGLLARRRKRKAIAA